jgi:hypothetical protein
MHDASSVHSPRKHLDQHSDNSQTCSRCSYLSGSQRSLCHAKRVKFCQNGQRDDASTRNFYNEDEVTNLEVARWACPPTGSRYLEVDAAGMSEGGPAGRRCQKRLSAGQVSQKGIHIHLQPAPRCSERRYVRALWRASPESFLLQRLLRRKESTTPPRSSGRTIRVCHP